MTPGELAKDYGFEVGTLLEGKYRIEGVLGAGSMAVVFRAVDVMLERPVAIKVMFAGNPELLHAEARAMARLRHENVVQVYAFGIHRELPFIVIELIEGTNLEETLRREGAIPLAACVPIIEKIAAGLEAAHREGIVHRDVKPGNVLIGPHFRVCVTDFGLTGVSRDPEVISGTPSYIAPESFLGTATRETAPLCDQYALGVTAYEMLTGHVPFMTESFHDLLRQAVEESVPPLDLPGVPPAVEAAIVRAMAKQPEERFASCSAFAEALRRAVTPAQVSTRPRAKTILIVDDDRHLRRLFAAVVEDALPDARVTTAADGLVAIELARERPPDLVLLDLEMPNLDGLGFLAELRAEDALRSTPVVVVSGSARHAALVLDEHGVVDQIAKPVDPAALAALVTARIERGS